tara:strand:+ start:205 stop:1626 length:1422 start_codon:yes stop_codon:yes gene_type:complete
MNYQGGLNGFGSTSQADLDELKKALEAGYALTNQTGGSALRVESLEASLKVVTHTNSHIKLWKKIPKSPAYSTVEEYNQLVSYGTADAGAFVREGELPQTRDTNYARRTALVKFMGVTNEVTHPATLVHPAHGDVIALENQNGILYLLERVEDALFHGDSSLAFDGEAEQWDGLDSLIDVNSFVDLEGQPLQEADIEEASNQVIEAFGYPTDMFLGTRAMSDLTKTFYPRERVSIPAPVGGQVGFAVQSMATQAGVIQFNPDVFLRQLKSPPAAATSANAPVTPGAVAAGAAGAAGSAEWTKQLGTVAAAPVFSYAVTACNRFGESAPVFANFNPTIANVNTNQSLGITITNAAAVGANPPEYFRIYRTRPGATSTTPADFSEILRVPAASQGNGVVQANVGVDRNFLIPHTEIAYLGELTPQVLTFRQLAPLMKLDIAVLAPAYRWMCLLYGTPILFAPRKWTRMINIGRIA